MDHAVEPAPAKAKIPRKARKLNREKVLQLAEAGMSTTDIAQHQQVHPTSVLRFLQQYQFEKGDLTQYKADRADVLAWMQSRNMAIQAKLIDRLDGLVDAVKPHQINGLLFALNTQHGTLFDKERLERGQSTSNISTISKMLDTQVSTLFKRQVIPHIDSKASIIPDKPENVE
ncbi:MAG TPA: helix-turn-helix domain-containing protein [Allocoleopsis sp.]